MKRYLTGIDWVVNALDYISRRKTGVGNTAQVVLELEGIIGEEKLGERLKIISRDYPVMFGYPSRAINLCPYWKVTSSRNTLRLNTDSLNLESDFDSIIRNLSQRLNHPFKDKREHILFNLIHQGKKSFLGMIFDHRLMEARGAEGFLDFVGGNGEFSLEESLYDGPSHLNRWLDKFRAGRKVNRAFLHLTEGRPRVLGLTQGNPKVGCRLINFNKERSSGIFQNAFNEAGYLMLMPYVLSKSIVILNQIFEDKRIPPQDYLIPVSIDTRPNDLVRKEVLFNHLSFFLFRITAQEAGSFKTVLSSVKKQIYAQIKIGLPQAIKEASFLMRIAPLFLVNILLKAMSKGVPASFSFAFIGEGAYASDNFMQIPVKNIFHIPRVPYPPGLGIFFNQYRGNINATFSYADGLLNEKEIEIVKLGINSLA